MNATELAAALNLSKGRISQLVSSGRLDGCFSGEGRARRYDPALVAERLKGTSDPGQMMGNGAATRRAIAGIMSSGAPTASAPQARSTDGAPPAGDDDSYEMLRAAKLAEETRALRRRNELEAGTLILASEVERQVAKVIRQEIAEVEEMLRTAARAIADRMGVDYRTARQILTETWRAQRAKRSDVLADQAAQAEMSDAEQKADI